MKSKVIEKKYDLKIFTLEEVKAIIASKRKTKTYSHEEILDKFIGSIGNPKRDAFEEELRLDILKSTLK